MIEQPSATRLHGQRQKCDSCRGVGTAAQATLLDANGCCCGQHHYDSPSSWVQAYICSQASEVPMVRIVAKNALHFVFYRSRGLGVV